MEDYGVIMSRLTEMRSRYDSGFSSSDRSYIERLYRMLLDKPIRKTGCADCYRDAYIEVFTYLKRTGKMPTKPNYILKAGVIVHPNGTNKFYANANIPDEVAEKRLAEFPESINDFLSYPSDYLIRVEARKNGEVSAPTDAEELSAAYKEAVEAGKKATAELAEKTEEAAALKEKLAATENELASVKEQLAALPESSGSDDDGTLAIENETLKADLAAANEEIAALKKELEDAKTTTSTKKRTSKSAE